MIALDTGILIYGTQAARRPQKKKLTPLEESRIFRATALLAELKNIDKKVIIPAPAAWEYVLDFPLADQSDIWASMTGFAVAPFDLAAARIASQIARQHYDDVVQSQKGQGKRLAIAAGARQQLKVDMQILSIAMAQRAEKIYTLEVERFTRWADGKILVVGLPQTQMLLNLE